MPSVSESYSLITQEAALLGNVLVLNQDFPPFRDIFGPSAVFRKYSSNWEVTAGYDEAMGEERHTSTKYNSERDYHRQTAGYIVDRLKNDLASAMQIRTRKLRGLDAIFKQEFEPLLWS